MRRLLATLAAAVAFTAIPATAIAAEPAMLHILLETEPHSPELFMIGVSWSPPYPEDSMEIADGEIGDDGVGWLFYQAGTYQIGIGPTVEPSSRIWELESIDCGDDVVMTDGFFELLPGDVVTCVITMVSEPAPSEAAPSPTPTPSPQGTAAPATPSASEGALGTPREDTLGGNPTPGVSLLPDTASDVPVTWTPSAVLTLVALASLGPLMYGLRERAPAGR